MKGVLINHLMFVLAIIVSTVSCNNSTNVAEGGIGGTGISMGAVSAVGSIWVNGVEYDTTGATIVIDGSESTDSSGTAGGNTVLPGMVVTVEGTIDGVVGSAATVTYENLLEGPVESTPAASTLVVLGQTVILDSKTHFRNTIDTASISELTSNNVVEVSGFRDENGAIRATYIEKKANSTDGPVEVELKGTITAVDATAQTITIGTQVVYIANASLIGFSTPAVNDFILAIGNYSVSGDKVLSATVVELKSSVLDTKDQDIAEMEGIVTEIGVPTGELKLDGQIVHFDQLSTVFNGGLPTDLAVGVKLEVEGSLQSGVVIADEITFEENIELQDNIRSVDSVNSTVTLQGLGLTVQYNMDTVLENGTPQAGQHVEILAMETGAGILAKRIKVSPPPEGEIPLMLFGPVDSIDTAAKTVTVLNIVGGPFNEFEIESLATPPDEATFFEIVKRNDLVEMTGILDGAQPVWDSIELDD